MTHTLPPNPPLEANTSQGGNLNRSRAVGIHCTSTQNFKPASHMPPDNHSGNATHFWQKTVNVDCQIAPPLPFSEVRFIYFLFSSITIFRVKERYNITLSSGGVGEWLRVIVSSWLCLFMFFFFLENSCRLWRAKTRAESQYSPYTLSPENLTGLASMNWLHDWLIHAFKSLRLRA